MITTRLRCRCGVALGAALAAFAWMAAQAQPVPKLDSISSTWFQRGTTNDVTLNGDGLGGMNAVLFTGRGLMGTLTVQQAATVTLESSAGGLSSAQAQNAKSATARIIVAADAPPGGSEIRVAGPNGVSNPLAVNLSDLPEIAEHEPNNQSSEAQMLTPPVSVSGVIHANTESDFFRFKARTGEKLVLDVQANRSGSPLDSTLVVLDSTGKELARNEDANGLDSFLEFNPPADGEYVAKVHDLRFQGGADYRYRLVVGAVPYLDFLFPFGGRRGTSVDLQLLGRNLDGADRMTLRVAADAPLGRQDVRAHAGRGLSNPQPFEAGDLPEFLESEPNNAADKANAVSAPMVINGRLGEAKDVDVFRFKAAADQKLVFDVQARRFGSPLDALLTLMDAQGNLLQRNDDASGPDARIEFDAKKDTEYLLSIRDLTDRGGDRFGYRITLQPPNTTPDYSVKALAGRFRVSRGGNTAIRLEVDRRNGFDGAIRVTADGLPLGVFADTLVFGSSGPNFGWLLLSATPEAPTGYFPLKLVTSGELAGRAVTKPVQLPEQGWLTVLPAAPFTLDVAQATALSEQNAGATVDVSIARREGFAGEVKVTAEELPGVSVPAATIPAGQSRAKLALNAAYNAEAGSRPLMIRGEGSVDGSTVVQYAANPVHLTTQGIPYFITAMLPGSSFFRTDAVKLQAVALPTNSTSAANSTEFVVKVDRRGLAGEIQLVIEGLPEGVNATVNNIAADKNEAAIKLLVTDKAPAGKEHKFTVNATAPFNDRTWKQKSVPVTLFIAAPEKEPVTAAASTEPPPPPAPTAAGAK